MQAVCVCFSDPRFGFDLDLDGTEADVEGPGCGSVDVEGVGSVDVEGPGSRGIWIRSRSAKWERNNCKINILCQLH